LAYSVIFTSGGLVLFTMYCMWMISEGKMIAALRHFGNFVGDWAGLVLAAFPTGLVFAAYLFLRTKGLLPDWLVPSSKSS
jgi:hypothetical protein